MAPNPPQHDHAGCFEVRAERRRRAWFARVFVGRRSPGLCACARSTVASADQAANPYRGQQLDRFAEVSELHSRCSSTSTSAAGGGWSCLTQQEPVTFETLEGARRAAYLYAARGRPCKLIARDAYQRVVRCEYIPGHDDVVSHNGWFG